MKDEIMDFSIMMDSNVERDEDVIAIRIKLCNVYYCVSYMPIKYTGTNLMGLRKIREKQKLKRCKR